MAFKNQQNEVFFLNAAGKAVYAWCIKLKPETYTPASDVEYEAYVIERAKLWGMVVENRGLAYTMLRQFPQTDVGEGFLVLLKAAKKWDPNNGTRFSTYACRALWNAYLSDHFKNEKCEHSELHESFEARPEHIESNTIQLVLQQLDEYDSHLLTLRFWAEFTLKEISEVIGVSRSLVHYQIKMILARCRVLIEEQDL